MSSAAQPLLRIPVGVVIERRKADSPWIDFTWRATGVLPDEPALAPWSVLHDDGDVTSFYLGSATVDLYRSEAGHYRTNLETGAAGIWVVLSPAEGERPYAIAIVTADPAEGEGYAEIATNLVEEVPMPEAIRETVARFVEEHHVEEEVFVKRKRRRADPEALARRGPGEHTE